jgi:hypothetical protein
MAYDAIDGYVVLWDLPTAWTETGFSGATWTYQGGVWTELDLGVHPGACVFSTGLESMAYDPADGYVLYLPGGNCTGQSSQASVWTFSAGQWTPHPSWTAPTNGSYFALVWDPATRYVLGYDGAQSWSFSGGTFQNLTPHLSSSPTHRTGSSMVYDAADGVVLLFGGTTRSGNLNDTWVFNGTGWRHLATFYAPPAGADYPISFDPATGRVVMLTDPPSLSESSPCRLRCNYTWTYVSGGWTNASIAVGDPPSGYWTFVSDPAANCSLLIGWPDAQPSLVHGDVWAIGSGAWVNRTRGFGPESYGIGPVQYPASLVYDAADHEVILFGILGCGGQYGGCESITLANATWAYRDGVWTNITRGLQPSTRYGESIAYDAQDRFVVLFGGWLDQLAAYPIALSDTWELLNGTWAPLNPALHPSARGGPSLVYDGSDGYLVLFGGEGYDVPGQHFISDNDTWTFSAGAWTNMTQRVGTAPATWSPTLTYDALDGYVLLLVRNGATVETWTYGTGRWTDLSATGGVHGSPPLLAINGGTAQEPAMAALAFDSSAGYAILYPGWANGTVYLYRSGTWSTVDTLLAPPGRAIPTIVDDPSDGYALMAGGGYADAWAWSNSSSGPGGGPLRVTSFIATANPIDVRTSTNLSVQIAGGTAPFSYSYTGLPSGCSSLDLAVLPCTPSQSGSFVIDVTVTDANGSRAAAQVDLSVRADPSVTSFAPSPASLVLGNRTVLLAAGTGGIGPMTFEYDGLPPGCTNQSVPELPCTPNAAGTYAPSVKVTDGLWTSASVSSTLTVACNGPASGPQICGFAANPPALILGNESFLWVNASGGTGVLGYQYSGLPPGCAPSSASVFPCTPSVSGTFLISVTVTDAQNRTASTSTDLTVYPVGGGAALQIAAFTAAPSVVSLGNSTVLELLTVGSASNLTYRYSGLPPGCPSQDVPALPCTPSETGSYHAHAVVSDGAGNSAGASLTIDVVTPAVLLTPLISVFVATPTVVPLGTNLTLLVSLSRGATPYLYRYGNLPAGCLSVDQPTLTCTPSTAGQFNVSVTVTDPYGHSASASTFVVVRQVPGGTPGTDLLGTPVAQASAFIAGAVIVGVLLETYRRRRQDRREGEAIVRTLTGDDPTGTNEPDHP